MKRFCAWLSAALLASALAAAPAHAAPVSLGASDMFTVDGDPAPFGLGRCTVTAVGTVAGERVALTAGHCGATGLVVRKAGVRVGVFERGTGLDYGLIRLDNHVTLRGTPRHVSVPSAWTTACKQGNGWFNRHTRCGWILNVTPTHACTTILLTPGDSGSPLYKGDRLLGIASEMWTPGCGPFSFTRLDAVVAATGFTLA